MSLTVLNEVNKLFNQMLTEDFLEESAKQDLLQHLADELNSKDEAINLINKFYNYKRVNRLGNMNPDPVYWFKQPAQEFIDALKLIDAAVEEKDAEKQKWKQYEEENTIYRDNNWFVIELTTYEAAKKYGKNTQWCITADNANKFGKTGEDHFEEYTSNGIRIYCYIKQNVSRNERNVGYTYNADGSVRSTYSMVEGGEKWAACVYPRPNEFNQIFDEHNLMVNDIPNKPSIPQIDRVPIVQSTIIKDDDTWLIQKFTGDQFRNNLYLTNKKSDGEEYIYWVYRNKFESDLGSISMRQFIDHSEDNKKLIEENPELFNN